MPDYSEYIELVVDGAAGIYAPQHFIESVDIRGASAEDVATVEAGPEQEWYWDAWDNIERDGYVEYDGHTWTILQLQDIFLIRNDAPSDMVEELLS